MKMPSPAPARQSRADAIAQWLADVAETAEPGDRLGSKDELRNRSGVSVGTFNEAIRLAQSRGVVTVRPGPGGGLFAAEQSPMVRLGHSVLNLDSDERSVATAIRIRDALDPLLVEDALDHATPADHADFRTHIVRMGEAVDGDEPDAVAFVRANWALHARIAEVSPNPVLRQMYLALLDLVESHTLAVMPAPEQPLTDYMRERHQLHADLVEAIAAGDRPRCLELIARHSNTAADATTA